MQSETGARDRVPMFASHVRRSTSPGGKAGFPSWTWWLLPEGWVPSSSSSSVPNKKRDDTSYPGHLISGMGPVHSSRPLDLTGPGSVTILQALSIPGGAGARKGLLLSSECPFGFHGPLHTGLGASPPSFSFGALPRAGSLLGLFGTGVRPGSGAGSRACLCLVTVPGPADFF